MRGIYWLASYPKSGNTWFRNVLANVMSDADEPVDINALETGGIASSRIWVDDVAGVDTADLTQDEIEALRPRVYRWSLQYEGVGYHKIHDAFTLTSEGRPLVDDLATLGAVYILRNPLDVAPSLANHSGLELGKAVEALGDPDRALARSDGKLSSQLRQFLGTWSYHVGSWVDAPGFGVLTIRYEDMLTDPHRVFGEALAFLGLDSAPERLARAIEFSRFERLAQQERKQGFRERPARAQRFFREGRAGSWRDSLTDAQVARIVADHGPMMRRFGYLDAAGNPV